MILLTPNANRSYKPRLVSGRSFHNCIGCWCQAALVVMVASGALDALADAKPTCFGVSLPAGSKKVGSEDPESPDAAECRYVSSLNWDETLKFMGRSLPSATRWHKEVNIPAAKYRHAESTVSKSAWEGVNVYQVGSDATSEVRLYVIPRPPEATPKKTDVKDGASKEKDKEKTTKKKKTK